MGRLRVEASRATTTPRCRRPRPDRRSDRQLRPDIQEPSSTGEVAACAAIDAAPPAGRRPAHRGAADRQHERRCGEPVLLRWTDRGADQPPGADSPASSRRQDVEFSIQGRRSRHPRSGHGCSMSARCWRAASARRAIGSASRCSSSTSPTAVTSGPSDYEGELDRHLRDSRADLDGRRSGRCRCRCSGRAAAAAPDATRARSKSYNHYLQGRFLWKKRTEQGLRAALDHFERAVQLDPTFARALSGIADCHLMLGMSAAEAPERMHAQSGGSRSDRRCSSTSRSAEAHASLAAVKNCYEWDLRAAEAGLPPRDGARFELCDGAPLAWALDATPPRAGWLRLLTLSNRPSSSIRCRRRSLRTSALAHAFREDLRRGGDVLSAGARARSAFSSAVSGSWD